MIYFLFIMFTPFSTHHSLEVALCSHHACFTVLGLVTGMCQWVELCQRLRKPSHVSLYEQSYQQFQCRAQEWTPADLNSLHNMLHPFLKVYAPHTYHRLKHGGCLIYVHILELCVIFQLTGVSLSKIQKNNRITENYTTYWKFCLSTIKITRQQSKNYQTSPTQRLPS